MVITDDGIRLNAELEKPDGVSGKCPLCIVIHGFTGHMDEEHILGTARAIRAAGIATLRVNMYGHGNSGGTFQEHTLYKWLTNAMTVIDYARSLDFVTELYLCGHSQGGLLVILAAALKHDVIDALIPMAPAVSIPDRARKGNLFRVGFDPENIPDVLHLNYGRTLSGNYVRVAQTIHVEEAVDRYTGPVLIIHGDADESVPIEDGIRTANRYRNCTLRVIPGDTHCYDYHLDQVEEVLTDWLTKLRQV